MNEFYESLVKSMIQSYSRKKGELPEWVPGETVLFIDNYGFEIPATVIWCGQYETRVRTKNSGAEYTLSNSRIQQIPASMADKNEEERKTNLMLLQGGKRDVD